MSITAEFGPDVAEQDARHTLRGRGRSVGWLRKQLAEENTLTAADAQAVEDAFQARLEALGAGG
jgi:hypothetical protein